jgi:plastocyanin
MAGTPGLLEAIAVRTLQFVRKFKRQLLIGFAVFVSLQPAIATDGQPILDLGIVSWLEYQKRQLLVDISEIKIHDGVIEQAMVTVSIYQAVIFENMGETNHRLVFMPDTDNKMEVAYSSAVIRPKERWGAEFHGFGVFPYNCTLHPEERGKIAVTL